MPSAFRASSSHLTLLSCMCTISSCHCSLPRIKEVRSRPLVREVSVLAKLKIRKYKYKAYGVY